MLFQMLVSLIPAPPPRMPVSSSLACTSSAASTIPPHVSHGERWQDHSFLASSAFALDLLQSAVISDAQSWAGHASFPGASHVSWRRPCRNNTALSISQQSIKVAARRNMFLRHAGQFDHSASGLTVYPSACRESRPSRICHTLAHSV